jgi:glycosyltransferase involved in cell wall biosynthesis
MRRGTVFLYPTLPRPFKNVELVCEAARLLETAGNWPGEIRITIKGDENSYARELVAKYGSLKSVRFIGLQSAAAMREQYEQAQCLVFPSKRETWGLPLTEAKQHGLSILAADLPYARESVGHYDGVSFFPVDDCQLLAEKMRAFTAGQGATTPPTWSPPAAPYAKDWTALIHLITSGLEPRQRTGLSADMHHD